MRMWETTGLAAVLLPLALSLGCGQQAPLQGAGSAQSEGQQIPFGAGKNGISPIRRLAPDSVPAGTPITVRMRASLSSASSRAGDSFEAVLAAPIGVDGEIVIPEGAAVTGRVVTSAKSSSRPEEIGYLRVTLATIEIGGKPVEVRTSSLFVKGVAREGRGADDSTARDAAFPTDRRLSFRLAQALPLGG